jgi:glycosyltransferase involved in cell wall biosynthesis
VRKKKNKGIVMKIFYVKLCIVLFFSYINAVGLTISSRVDLVDYEAPTHKRFVIIICSRNNAKWVEQNLESVFSQDYPRDKVCFIYVDDNSTDNTPDLVAQYVSAKNEWDRFILIRNNTWQSVMANHYKAAYLCDDDDIIVHVDGDDMLKGSFVLQLLNKVYNRWDIWLTYGQYEDWPISGPGFSIDVPHDIVEQNKFREFGFWYSHPRTFYAWLFKKIHLKDLIWKGSFIPTTPTIDYMMMFPMMEMAGQGHFCFIRDWLYLYNRSNALSTCNMPIKLEIPPASSWAKYQALTAKDDAISQRSMHKSADIIIIADDAHDIERFISQELSKISSVGTVIIINPDEADVISQISSLSHDYCLIITDMHSTLPECSLETCIYELERTYAAAFFFGLTSSSFKACSEAINYGPYPEAIIDYHLVFLNNGVVAWQFAYEMYVWEDPALFNAMLLRKENIEAIAREGSFTKETIKQYMHTLMAQDREIGLLFEEF